MLQGAAVGWRWLVEPGAPQLRECEGRGLGEKWFPASELEGWEARLLGLLGGHRTFCGGAWRNGERGRPTRRWQLALAGCMRSAAYRYASVAHTVACCSCRSSHLPFRSVACVQAMVGWPVPCMRLEPVCFRPLECPYRYSHSGVCWFAWRENKWPRDISRYRAAERWPGLPPWLQLWC